VAENQDPKPKKKKPPWQKHMTVYFNTNREVDNELYQYLKQVGSRNFSGFMKYLVYEYMKQRVTPPSPYEFEFTKQLEKEMIPVKVKETKRPTIQQRMEPPAEELKKQEKVIIKVDEKEYDEKEPTPLSVQPKEKKPKPIEVDPVNEDENSLSFDNDMLDNFLSTFKK
jgi:hypothetical protein